MKALSQHRQRVFLRQFDGPRVAPHTPPQGLSSEPPGGAPGVAGGCWRVDAKVPAFDHGRQLLRRFRIVELRPANQAGESKAECRPLATRTRYAAPIHAQHALTDGDRDDAYTEQ